MANKIYTNDQLRAFAKSYKSGLSLEEVAIKYRCTAYAVRKALVKYDIPVRSSAVALQKLKAAKEMKTSLIVKLHLEGKDDLEIARETGAGLITIERVLHQYANSTGEILDLPKVRALMNAGWSCEDIADEFRTDIECAKQAMERVLAQRKKV